jgi:hypothetical protein
MFATPLVTTPPVGEAESIVILPIKAETTKLIFPPFRMRNRELKSGLYFILNSFKTFIFITLTNERLKNV